MSQPGRGASAGEAMISPACRAFLASQRAPCWRAACQQHHYRAARRRRSTHGLHVGVQRRHSSASWPTTMAASIDYVGNRGRDNTGVIDINEGPVDPANGRITRLGVNVFDPNGELVTGRLAAPPSSSSISTRRCRRLTATSTRWSSISRSGSRTAGPAARATLRKCHDVPLGAGGATAIDSRQRSTRRLRPLRSRQPACLSGSANFDLGKGFGTGFVFRTYSGYPINETIGTDFNGDGNNNDRPKQGVNDQAPLPSGNPGTILSPLDSRGVAIRNGLDGERKTILDGRFQYVHRFGRYTGGSFPRDLQPDESNELRQPDGRAEFQQLPQDGRGRQCADRAARRQTDLLGETR